LARRINLLKPKFRLTQCYYWISHLNL